MTGMGHLPLRVAARALALAVAVQLSDAPSAAEGTLACPELYPGGTVPFAGLYPAIEERLPLSRFRANEIVEIDPTTMTETEARAHIAELQALPARVSIYLPGGHCNIRNKDCLELQRAGVRLGNTGSWNWDKDERRILDITHPTSVRRIGRGAERGWRLGANYIRVDNLHHPAGSAEPRTPAQIKVVIDALHDIEDGLRKAGVIAPNRPTGVVAHNNLDVWEELIRTRALRRPPVFLTSERTAQLARKGEGYSGDALMKGGRLQPTDVAEIEAGRRIAVRLGIPYTVAEFQISHDLAGRPGATYLLPAAYVDQLAALPGITEVIVIPSESQYVGRGKAYGGPGPRALAAAPHGPDATNAAAACLRR